MNFDAVKDCLIAEARRAGLEEFEVFFMESSDRSTETLKDEISSFSSGVSGGVCFRCVVDGHMGSASTELLSEHEMKALVKRAMEGARIIENDDKAILFEGSERYETVENENFFETDTAKLKEIALTVQKNTYAEDPSVSDGTQSGVFSNEIRMVLMNSKGLRLTNTASISGAYVQAVVQRDGEAQEAFDFSVGLEKTDLEDISRRAVRKAVSKLGAAEIESGKYDVLIDGEQMRSLLSSYSSVFSAKNAQKGLSLLKGKEGEVIAAPIVTLVDDPMRRDCPMKTFFDGEGVATYKKNVIENGVLRTLLYDLSTADRAGVASTGNGQRTSYAEAVGIKPFSFYLVPGEITHEALLKKVGDGVYITAFKGLHAGCNAVTGDFSIECEGYRIRDGRVCEAIKSFTVAGNFFDLLKEIEEVGDRVKFGIPSGFTVFGSPDVLIRSMSIGGK